MDVIESYKKTFIEVFLYLKIDLIVNNLNLKVNNNTVL